MNEQDMRYREIYDICLKKVLLHMDHMYESAYELRGCRDGNYYVHEPGVPLETFDCWLASMSVGMALIAYQTQGDERMLKWADSFEKQYHNISPLNEGKLYTSIIFHLQIKCKFYLHIKRAVG